MRFNAMTEERHECKTYAEMLAVLREAKAGGHTAWWNSEELRNGELIVYVRKEENNG
jgi:hypothetical protein